MLVGDYWCLMVGVLGVHVCVGVSYMCVLVFIDEWWWLMNVGV